MATETTKKNQTNKPDEATDAVQAAAHDGIDVAQLRDNLALSVAERLRRLTLDALIRSKQALNRPRSCPVDKTNRRKHPG